MRSPVATITDIFLFDDDDDNDDYDDDNDDHDDDNDDHDDDGDEFDDNAEDDYGDYCYETMRRLHAVTHRLSQGSEDVSIRIMF